MALADIRTAIAAALAEVTEIGKVNAYDVLATREEDFKTFFFDQDLGYVQGWAITREMTSEKDKDTEMNWSTHLMVIRGYRPIGAGGTTELEFQDKVEDVRVRLRREQRDQLGQTATLVGPPSVRILEPRMFGSYLVHYVEILLPVMESVVV
jgi:hypothetical protein